MIPLGYGGLILVLALAWIVMADQVLLLTGRRR